MSATGRFLGSFGAGPVWLGQSGELDVAAGNDFTVILGVRVQGGQTRLCWSNSATGNDGWRFRIAAGPTGVAGSGIQFIVGDDVGAEITAALSPVLPLHNGVHLIVGQYEAGVAIKLFVDGNLRDTTVLPGNYIPSASVAQLGDGVYFSKVSEAAFSKGLLTDNEIADYFNDYFRTGLLRPGALVNADLPATLANLDSVYSIARSQRTVPVQAFPSVGTGSPAVTLNVAAPGPYARDTYFYDTVPLST